jgi:2-keto-4-pentenoate hydratase/2-oxohepta-3-ene-1,7-dioic acid hydratase in catechol pathway
MAPSMDRIYRVAQDGETFYACERGGELRRVSPAGGDIFSSDLSSGFAAGVPVRGGLGAVTVLAPVRPGKMVCVGLNYRDHAAEMRKPLPAEPLLFMKPSTAVLGPGDAIRIPPGVGRVDYEAELAVVIGRRARRVPRANAWDYIFGLTCLNDVTARDLQTKDVQYTRAKGFDTFAPIGPCIALASGGANGSARTVEGFVNGERRQASNTGQLIFPIDALVEFVTFVMTLEPGDVISTGTPSGVGPLRAGDVVTVTVEGVGELRNPVEDEP